MEQEVVDHAAEGEAAEGEAARILERRGAWMTQPGTAGVAGAVDPTKRRMRAEEEKEEEEEERVRVRVRGWRIARPIWARRGRRVLVVS